MATTGRKNRNKRPGTTRKGSVAAAVRPEAIEPGDDSPPRPSRSGWARLVVGGALLAAAFAWAYWPALVKLVAAWNKEPDYSHGYLVVPLAVFFLWARRDQFPGLAPKLAWSATMVIALSIGIRIVGGQYYVDAIDAWSMLFWIAGMVWLLCGWPVLRWSLPSVAFLWFMIPLPWHAEKWLSLPLQRIATTLSCWALQCLGQPALAEGNTIYLGDIHVEVEQACSGLRIFMGIVALAFAYMVLVRRTWWEKALLMVSVVPIALIANATRIVVTALLFQYVSEEASRTFTHDLSGWVMIPFAAAMFGFVLWYLGKLVREVAVVDVGDLVREAPV